MLVQEINKVGDGGVTEPVCPSPRHLKHYWWFLIPRNSFKDERVNEARSSISYYFHLKFQLVFHVWNRDGARGVSLHMWTWLSNMATGQNIDRYILL